jgi:adenylate cyclase
VKLKPERWGSTLVQEKYREGKASDKRHPYRTIIITIIIIKLKYKSLCIEIQRTWNLKCTIIPVINGDTGIVTRSLRKNFEAVPGKHSINSLQQTAVLGTAHIIWKVLRCET